MVIQGPVQGKCISEPQRQWTAKACAESIRSTLPKAHVIVSTWRGSDTEDIDCNVVLESDDPGTIVNKNGCAHNFARQLESTRKGLTAIPDDRPFALKIRTDMRLHHTGFMDAFDRYTARAGSLRILQDRIIGLMHFTRHSRRGYFLFCWSDLIHFGCTSDLRRLWDIPSMPIVEERMSSAGIRELLSDLNLLPEQYLWSHLFQQHLNLAGFQDVSHHPDGIAEVHDLALINNFIPLLPETFGAEWVGRRIPLQRWMNLFSEGEIERLYRQFCEPGFKPARSIDWSRLGKECLFLIARLRLWLLHKSPGV